MKKQNLFLAAGILFCAAVFGLGVSSKPTYAITEEENDAVTMVMDSLRLGYDILIDENNAAHPEYQVSLSRAYSDNALVFYKPDSINAAIQLLRSQYIWAVDGTGEATGVYDWDSAKETMTDYLVNLGFEEYPYSYYGTPRYYEYINQETGVICAIAPYGVDCSHINWWSIADEWATFINGIGEAYYKANNKYPVVDSVRGEIPVYNSEYKPYQYASVNMPDHHSLFYRKSPTSEWVFFAGTQDEIDCNEYDSEAIKGFAGTTCYDSKAEKIVKITVPEDEESSIKVPDTGLFTSDTKGLLSSVFAISISIACVITYILYYFIKHRKAKVKFNK